MITRRATRRYFLFRPDRDGTCQQIYWYTTAVVAAKFGIQLHAVQVLSTHIHEVLTDVHGNLPAFLRERNRLLANALKCHRGWPEEVFQRAPASCVELYGPEAIAKQIGYTLANCVEAGLVNDPAEWPGVTVTADDIGRRTVVVERPNVYFDPENPTWPAQATIAITMPELLVQAYGARAHAVVRRVVRSAIDRARSLAQAAGHRVSRSVAGLYSVPFTKRSRGAEPFGQRNPTFAAGGNRECLREALEDRRTFRTLYRRALDALKAGIRGIPFPIGSWRWLRELLPTPKHPTIETGRGASDESLISRRAAIVSRASRRHQFELPPSHATVSGS